MKTALIALDGWGLGGSDGNNAVEVAHTPFVDRLNLETPHMTTLRTDGEHGWACLTAKWATAKVRHMNIGAGRVVYQDLLRIDRAVADGTFAQEPVLTRGTC